MISQSRRSLLFSAQGGSVVQDVHRVPGGVRVLVRAFLTRQEGRGGHEGDVDRVWEAPPGEAVPDDIDQHACRRMHGVQMEGSAYPFEHLNKDILGGVIFTRILSFNAYK